MNKHTILLVDASGSMSSHTEDTRRAICSIIKELDKSVHLTLVFFDTERYNVVCDDCVINIAPEVAYTYKSLRGTPITDSIYKSIQDIISSVPLEGLIDPHKIIVYTDGEENSSHYVTVEDCGRAIEHMTENFGWDFQYIGPKSEEEGIRKYTGFLKIRAANVTLYADMSEGLKEMREVVLA